MINSQEMYCTLAYRLPGAIPGAPHRPPHCGTPVFIAAVGGQLVFSILVSIGSAYCGPLESAGDWK